MSDLLYRVGVAPPVTDNYSLTYTPVHAEVPVFTFQNHVLLEDTGSGYGTQVCTSVSLDPGLGQVAVTESSSAGTGRFLMLLRIEVVGYPGYFVEDDFIVDVYDLTPSVLTDQYYNIGHTAITYAVPAFTIANSQALTAT